ncbi:MAG TPA: hypothetical protein PLD32_12535 [Saprospiraceae bacterium]|nr:hypothetical protein [Saprospiraceae bacterium]HNG70104.1 hypothetical protein [Saprospiraceae bacterium]
MPQVNYNEETGTWYATSEVALTEPQKVRLVNFARSTFTKRLSGMQGPRRKRMQDALLKLSPLTLQVFLDSKKESTLYFQGKY